MLVSEKYLTGNILELTKLKPENIKLTLTVILVTFSCFLQTWKRKNIAMTAPRSQNASNHLILCTRERRSPKMKTSRTARMAQCRPAPLIHPHLDTAATRTQVRHANTMETAATRTQERQANTMETAAIRMEVKRANSMEAVATRMEVRRPNTCLFGRRVARSAVKSACRAAGWMN